MSFRWFVYYGALFGAWAGFVGWFLGRLLWPEPPPGTEANDMTNALEAGVKGLFLGLPVALALGVVDAFWNTPSGRWGIAFLRVFTCALVGPIGGFVGGVTGQALFGTTQLSGFLIFGWTITGLLIGASIGVFDLLAALVAARSIREPLAKFFKGLVGGAVGGLLGGFAVLYLRDVLKRLFEDDVLKLAWSPTAIGFTIVGLCIGLMVGLAQVLFREAWIRVQSGFRAGRELILSKEETVIGRAEGSDLGLFGDADVDPRHARIVRRDGQYFLEDSGARGGTFLNDTLVTQPSLLQTGDLIRVGRSVLRFGERHRRGGEAARTVATAGRS